jgi:hypothetical protein
VRVSVIVPVLYAEPQLLGATPIYRIGERGFGSALRRGFAEASGEGMVPIMGDASEDPEDLLRLVREFEQGWDRGRRVALHARWADRRQHDEATDLSSLFDPHAARRGPAHPRHLERIQGLSTVGRRVDRDGRRFVGHICRVSSDTCGGSAARRETRPSCTSRRSR